MSSWSSQRNIGSNVASKTQNIQVIDDTSTLCRDKIQSNTIDIFNTTALIFPVTSIVSNHSLSLSSSCFLSNGKDNVSINSREIALTLEYV